jgi:undecaprenyl-diphosphatase
LPLIPTALAAVLAALLTVTGMRLARTPGHHRPTDKVAEATGLRGRLDRRLGPVQVSGVAFVIAVAALIVAALAFGLGAVAATRAGLWEIDAGPARWGSENATPVSTAILRAATWLGSTIVVCLAGLAAGLWDWWRRRRPDGLLFLVAVIAGQNLIANAVKLVVARERPPLEALAAESGYSFPSGHTAAAAATWAAVALLLARGRSFRARTVLAAGAALICATVASSRVLLGVHWFTDVVGGAALGYVWFGVCALLVGGTRLRLGAELERSSLTPGPRPTGGEAMTGSASEPSDPAADGVPSDEQVESRADELEAEPGNAGAGTPGESRRQAEALLEESEERIADPASRDPGDDSVIRRPSDEGVETSEP